MTDFKRNKKLLVICGPTATGKTALGIKLAKKFGGEIISADSRQIYLGMDIGTGKDLEINSKLQIPRPRRGDPSSTESRRGREAEGRQNCKLKTGFNNKYSVGYYLIGSIPVWLYDIVTPDRRFSVAEYVKLAIPVIKNLFGKSTLPIVVGGTGLYIKALTEPLLQICIPPNKKLRRQLNKASVAQLADMLKKQNPQKFHKMTKDDRQNPRRLIRIIEINLHQDKYNKSNFARALKKFSQTIDTLFIGLMAPQKDLYKQIDARVLQRINQGMEKEVADLLSQGYKFSDPGLNALGYSFWKDFFEKKINRTKLIEKWQYAEHRYARRQITWFKKQAQIKWFDIKDSGFQTKIEKEIFRWYNGFKL